MVWSKIVWFQIMNLMVWAGSGVGKSAQRSLGLGLVLSECIYIQLVESVKQSFSIMIFVPVVEHAPTLTVCLSLTNFNTLRPRQNGRHFPDDNFKCISLNENVGISLKISLKFVHMDRIDNISALVQIMAWRRSGDKPLSEPMMVSLLMHICVTRPQWVKEPISQKDLWKFWFDKSLWKLSWVLNN